VSNDAVTPADLARDLGLSPKTVRNWLRRKYGTLSSRNESRWLLTDVQVTFVRHLAAGHEGEETR